MTQDTYRTKDMHGIERISNFVETDRLPSGKCEVANAIDGENFGKCNKPITTEFRLTGGRYCVTCDYHAERLRTSGVNYIAERSIP